MRRTGFEPMPQEDHSCALPLSYLCVRHRPFVRTRTRNAVTTECGAPPARIGYRQKTKSPLSLATEVALIEIRSNGATMVARILPRRNNAARGRRIDFFSTSSWVGGC